MQTIQTTQIETVGDLRNFLKEHDQSPEEFALLVAVSNMTIRRLLKKTNNAIIPIKYQNLMKETVLALSGTSNSSNSLNNLKSDQVEPIEIVKQGFNRSEEEILKMISLDISNDKIKSSAGVLDSAIKLESSQKNPVLKSKVKKLISIFEKKSPLHMYRAVIVGGLLYFINPFDLIPDAILSLGFLDDIGIMSLILKKITKRA